MPDWLFKNKSEVEKRIDKAKTDRATELNLSSLGILELPETIGELTHLEELYLSGNELKSLPVSIGSLTHLKLLYLQGNQLDCLPDAIGNLSSLELLCLQNNQLSALPESICNLHRLKQLYLYNNQLSSLPASIGNLSSIQRLYLHENQLDSVPESIAKLSSLQRLHLYSNKLSSLTAGICSLSSLEKLYLDNNDLSSIPERIGDLSSLEELSLHGNRLSFLPESIGNLSRLQQLSLYNNQLTSLPESIWNLSGLQHLSLRGNQLSSLSENIVNLRSLWHLDLAANRLRSLPENIGNLSGLQQLCLEGNRLQSLPDSLSRCLELDYLFLHENPDLDLAEDALGPSMDAVFKNREQPKPPREILEYYFSTRGGLGQPLREFKLILVGKGKAGKTSLIRRMRGDAMRENEPETHGINLEKQVFMAGEEAITARVWDFGGQHVLHAMHEFFLTARALYLVVLTQREETGERDAAYWLQLIRGYAPDAPVVVALNQSRGVARDMDRKGLEQRFGNIAGWVATDCAEGYDATIAALKDQLCDVIATMDGPRARFPRKWYEIKQWAEHLPHPFVPYTEFQVRCRAAHEEDPEKQEQLAVMLHDLGVALNYMRDPRLHDTTVLRPNWLANGIYSLLRANQNHNPPMAPDGVLTYGLIGEIIQASAKLGMLEAHDYPQDKWEFLLRLMEAFALSFPLDEEGSRQLVPALLPASEPSGAKEPEGPHRIRVGYDFDVVPAPLIPRLMVRLFSLIVDRLLWNRGAIFTYGNASAKAWTTQDERWVYFTVAGPVEERDELLEMMQTVIYEMIAEYRRLAVREMQEYEGEWASRKLLERQGLVAARPGVQKEVAE